MEEKKKNNLESGKLKEALETWNRDVLGKTLKKNPETRERFSTISNLEINRLYTPLDTEKLDYLEDQGWPGEYPASTSGIFFSSASLSEKPSYKEAHT